MGKKFCEECTYSQKTVTNIGADFLIIGRDILIPNLGSWSL